MIQTPDAASLRESVTDRQRASGVIKSSRSPPSRRQRRLDVLEGTDMLKHSDIMNFRTAFCKFAITVSRDAQAHNSAEPLRLTFEPFWHIGGQIYCTTDESIHG